MASVRRGNMSQSRHGRGVYASAASRTASGLSRRSDGNAPKYKPPVHVYDEHGQDVTPAPLLSEDKKMKDNDKETVIAFWNQNSMKSCAFKWYAPIFFCFLEMTSLLYSCILRAIDLQPFSIPRQPTDLMSQASLQQTAQTQGTISSFQGTVPFGFTKSKSQISSTLQTGETRSEISEDIGDQGNIQTLWTGEQPIAILLSLSCVTDFLFHWKCFTTEGQRRRKKRVGTDLTFSPFCRGENETGTAGRSDRGGPEEACGHYDHRVRHNMDARHSAIFRFQRIRRSRGAESHQLDLRWGESSLLLTRFVIIPISPFPGILVFSTARQVKGWEWQICWKGNEHFRKSSHLESCANW